MRYLVISVLLILFSCKTYPTRQGLVKEELIPDEIILNGYFSNPEVDYVYKANINVYDNNFSGIFIVKKTGEKSHRVVFTTEMGNKLFDFSFENGKFEVNYILENINKKRFIKILRRDFQVLIREVVKVDSLYSINNEEVIETKINNQRYYFYKNGYINKIVSEKNGKQKVVFIFSKVSNKIAQQINIKHIDVKLNIKLKSI